MELAPTTDTYGLQPTLRLYILLTSTNLLYDRSVAIYVSTSGFGCGELGFIRLQFRPSDVLLLDFCEVSLLHRSNFAITIAYLCADYETWIARGFVALKWTI